MVSYIRWDDPRVEHKDPQEDQYIQKACEQVNQIQQMQFENHHHCFGATHARTHAIVKGEMQVRPDLPTHLQQSLWSESNRKYPVMVRYSTEPGDPGLDDRMPQPRGLGLKIFNVEGKKLGPEGVDMTTQDIEFNNAPALELGNAKVCTEILGLRINYGTQPDKLKAELQKRPDAEVQQARNKLPNINLAGHRQYSQSALRFGDYVAKLVLVPSSDMQKRMSEQWVKQEQSTLCVARVVEGILREE